MDIKKLLIGITILLICMVAFSDPIPIPHPAGSDSQIQYNNGGLFGGDSTFTFNDSTKAIGINNSVIGNDTVSFKPTTDSTTFFQILDADGGTPILNIDATNERIGIGTVSPSTILSIAQPSDSSGIKLSGYDDVSGSYQLITIDSLGDTQYSATGSNIFYSGSGKYIAFVSGGIILNKLGDNAGVDEWRLRDSSNVNVALIDSDGNGYLMNTLGIGELAPETLLEMTSTVPYITLHNDTHEDTDGGRESRLNFKGEQSGGEETTLARIEVSHDGTSDDQKGKIVISTNDGSDADTPTTALTIDSTQTVTGKLRSSDGVSGTLVMDDGTTEKITLVFTGGILTSKTVEATTSSALMDWTD